jgi:hypothetical protein
MVFVVTILPYIGVSGVVESLLGFRVPQLAQRPPEAGVFSSAFLAVDFSSRGVKTTARKSGVNSYT